jgi:two-component system cell cycle sensor histidine kinase/response regulator CckA
MRKRLRGMRSPEEQLRLYRLLVENSLGLMCTHDLQGTLLSINPAAAEALGYRQEECVGQNLETLLVPSVRHLFDAYLQRIRSNPTDSGLMRLLAKDGTERIWYYRNLRYDEQEGTAQVLGHAMDITERIRVERTLKDAQAALQQAHDELAGRVAERTAELQKTNERLRTEMGQRKQAEEELRRRELYFRSLIENVSDLITVVNREGIIQYQSPSGERVLGYLPVDLIGRNAFEFIHSEDILRLRSAHKRAWEDRPARRPVEYRFRHRNGTWLVLQSIGRRVPDENLIVVNSRDVTFQKQLERQLHQAQKMEAIGRLAGGVAHDFNNLLLVISGHGELLERRLPLREPLRESVAEIRKATDRAAAVTCQLLAFSRRQVMKPRILDINGVVENAEKMLRPLIGEHVALATKLGSRLSQVCVDTAQIDQVILNLVLNARDAMPRGGTVTIETRQVEWNAADVKANPEVRPGRYVLLQVTDNGCGMTPEIQARLFEPFFSTKEEGMGSGLGLAVVHGIVQQSGGYMGVDTRQDVGTTFKVYLPAVKEPAEGLTDPVRSELLRGSETVLLVEDEEAVREVTALLLQTLGYRVLKASNGEEAMRFAEAGGEKIHLLMVDVVMPGLSGRQLAEVLQSRDPNLRVLFQSGYNDDAVLRCGIVGAEVAFLPKPFTLESLARKVREVLDG